MSTGPRLRSRPVHLKPDAFLRAGSLNASVFKKKAAAGTMHRAAISAIYSIKKRLVAVATMMLVEDGKMELTDPVSKFLPAMKNMQVSVARTDAEFARATYSLAPVE